MKDLEGFAPYFTAFDFGVRKQDKKGFIEFGASVSGSVPKGYRVFIASTGKHSALLADPVLFHELHVAVSDVVGFYDLCESIVEESPKLVKGL